MTGEYKCQKCDRSFGNAHGLRVHVSRMHKTKRKAAKRKAAKRKVSKRPKATKGTMKMIKGLPPERTPEQRANAMLVRVINTLLEGYEL